jgi:hypothetical protein
MRAEGLGVILVGLTACEMVIEKEVPMTLNHDGRDTCPVTGEEIPNGYAWTDHEKKGCFNSCLSCCPDHEHVSVGSALRALEAKRENDVKDDQ